MTDISPLKIGDKIKMDGQRQRFTVQGIRGQFILATKPFNAKRTYLYTLIDLDEEIRGPLNSIFGLFCDVDTPEGAKQLFDWIEEDGGFEVWHVSHRNYKPLSEGELVALKGPIND